MVSGRPHTQKNVATSSASAELVEIYETAKTLQSMFGLCMELGVDVEAPPVILADSETTIRTLKKPLTEAQKHLGFCIAFLKQVILWKQFESLPC